MKADRNIATTTCPVLAVFAAGGATTTQAAPRPCSCLPELATYVVEKGQPLLIPAP